MLIGDDIGVPLVLRYQCAGTVLSPLSSRPAVTRDMLQVIQEEHPTFETGSPGGDYDDDKDEYSSVGAYANSNESNNRHLSVVRIKPPAPRQFRVILDCIYADYSCAEDAAAVLSPDNFVGVYLNAQFTLADVLQDACCIWFARNWRSVISRDTFRWHTLDAPALLVLMRTPALTVTTTAAETLSILLSWARGVDWSRPAWSRDFRAVVRELVNCDEIAARELATLACDFGDPLALAIGVDCVIRLARPRTASAYLRSRVMTLRRAACDLVLAFARRLEALRRLRTDHSRGTSLPSISLDLIFLPRFPCRPPHFLAVRL
ncbi:hypothetical protein HDU82_007018 [Entophlyctis luteolus]|nr:hypothetical protein HDU82_007018 [Entophlyctis luteolus]